MDEFGVLVESIGFKTQGKSAPMANLKGKTNINNGISRNFVVDSGFDTKLSSINRSKSVYNSNSANGSFVDDLDGVFRSSNTQKMQNYGGFDSYDDVFGGPILSSKPSESRSGGSVSTFDFDSIFKVSNNSGAKSPVSHLYDDGDDIFGRMPGPGLKSSGTVNYDDVFGTFASPPRQNDSIDDLLGNFGGVGSESNNSRRKSVKVEESASEFDDLIPGFGGSSLSSNGAKSETREERGASEIVNDLESFFSMGTQPSSAARPRSTTEDPVFDILFQERGESEVERISSRSSSSTKKAASVTNFIDNFSSLFGEAAPSSGVFQEIEGESEERRRARLNHHMRTQARMAKALDEKNQRDLQTQQEQEERHRLAETLDDDIKRWAAGKEGNLRALLSSLQYVLQPECGWQPVSLTDLITSTSVKKVYYKATLCVHPDKVQQKGANLQQRYIAEKVFDLLKEAWNKFNAEELR